MARPARCMALPALLMLLCVALPATRGAAAQEDAADIVTGPDIGHVRARRMFERRWHHHLHRLTSMVVDDRPLAELLGPVLRHRYELPPVQIAKSLVYLGPNYRLRRVVHDLMRGGKTIRVGAIGGSITHGAKASRIQGENGTDWFSLVSQYMKAAFPRSTVITRNGALPATPSALMNMCLETYVDAEVDLLFVEYVANDGPNRFDPVKPKVYERLLRKIMQMKHQPAVVLMQLMPKGMAYAPGVPNKANYPDSLEDVYGSYSQYYDLPWLSFRNAMWRLAELHRYGFNWTDYMWDVDFMHPIDPGMRVIADTAVNLIQTTATSLYIQPFGISDKEMLQEPLPVPMNPGNWEAHNIMCIYGEGLARYVDAAASQGWQNVNEGGPGKAKWGFISTTPGSVLKVKINSTRREKAKDGDDRMNVMLAYLKSYNKMGKATFSCMSGCTCEAEEKVDGLHDSPTSTIFLVRLLVTQHPECVIGIKLLDESSSGEHKFKVSGIMMNEYTGKDVTTRLHEEQWLTTLQVTSSQKDG